MGFRETMAKKYTDAYLNKYGDRMTQLQGRVLSVKVTEKRFLWFRYTLMVDVIIKPERSKAIIKCFYKVKKWFKKPQFMQLNQGNLVIIQGLKGKKGKENSELIQILNVKNMTTKKDLIKTDQKVQKVQQKQFIR